MTAKDKKQIQYLAVLLVIAGAVFYYFYGKSGVTTSADTGRKQKPKTKKEQVVKDPQIHLEALAVDADSAVGQKNLFQYRQKPVPVVARPIPVPVQTQVFIPPTTNIIPQPPPAPVMKAFKYDGFSGGLKGSKLMASLTDGAATYQVTLGECIMGQYCVRTISESSIEIEDIQLKLRRTFQRTPITQ